MFFNHHFTSVINEGIGFKSYCKTPSVIPKQLNYQFSHVFIAAWFGHIQGFVKLRRGRTKILPFLTSALRLLEL